MSSAQRTFCYAEAILQHLNNVHFDSIGKNSFGVRKLMDLK